MTNLPSQGVDIQVPSDAAFRITQTRVAGTNKRYRVHWKDSKKADEWLSKEAVLRLLGK